MLGYNPSAITKEDLDIYAEKYSAPGAMRDGFEYYRAFPLDAVQNKALVTNLSFMFQYLYWKPTSIQYLEALYKVLL